MSPSPSSMRRCARSSGKARRSSSPTSSPNRTRNSRKEAAMLPSRFFADLTQPEIAAQLKKNPLVILPCGSVEQHGPHLPTGTDTLAANVIAHAVAERMDGLVLPATPFGVTPMHMPYEGTITLTPDTYMRVQTETCGSTAKHGAKQLMIINWHEGNIPSL